MTLNSTLQDSFHLVECSEVSTKALENAFTDGCSALLGIFSSNKTLKKSSDETFKFNAKLRKRHQKTDQYYPECPQEDEWNSKDVRQKILDWKYSIFNNEHLHWFHNSSHEPLDPFDPKIEITFDQLVNRKGFEKQKASHYFNVTIKESLFLKLNFYGRYPYRHHDTQHKDIKPNIK
jgi:hypothetical protein